jgi:hypothetical protein
MFKHILTGLMTLTIVASAQPFMQPDNHFFGIPNVDSLSTSWMIDVTDTTDIGFLVPADFDVLRLSATD